MKTVVLVFVLSTLSLVAAYNVLAVFPLPPRSLLITFKPLFIQLSSKGHNVTVISHFMGNDMAGNITVIILDSYNILREMKYISILETDQIKPIHFSNIIKGIGND